MSKSKLDPNKVPASLTNLLPMAEAWGIGDDYEREKKVASASLEELEELIHSIDQNSNEDLFGWLAGPEADNPFPSAEYVAITCLTMAIDSARLRLARIHAGTP